VRRLHPTHSITVRELLIEHGLFGTIIVRAIVTSDSPQHATKG
jgi:hypothetical protein